MSLSKEDFVDKTKEGVEEMIKSDEKGPEQEIEEGAAEEDVEREETEENEINLLNWLNLGAYIVNVVLVYAVGVGGILGRDTTNEVISDKYPTLVTPKGTAFAIWGVIFVLQLGFIIAQFFAQYRSTPAVQQGVSFWYVSVCLFQVAWSFAFAKEVIWLAVVLMFGIWISLVSILYNQYYISSERGILDYILLRLPFDIHAGWITTAFILNVNVLLKAENANNATQLGVGIISLAALLAVSAFVLFALREYANYTVALVFIWALSFIAVKVNDADNNALRTIWSETILQAFKIATIALAIIISIQIVVRAVIDIVNIINALNNPETAEERSQSAISNHVENNDEDEKRVPLLEDDYAV